MKKNKIKAVIVLLSVFFFHSQVFSAERTVKNDQKQLFVDDQIRFATGLSERHYYTAAIDEYKRVIKKFPKDPVVAEAYLRLAETYADTKNFNKAIIVFDEFFRLFPGIRIIKSGELRYALAILKSPDKEHQQKALKILHSLKEDKEASNVIKDAAVYHLGKLFLQLGRKQAAINEFKQIAYKKSQSENDKFKAFSALELADLVKPETGVKLLLPISESISLPPYILNPATWKLAGIYKSLGKYRKAAELYGKCSLLFTEKETKHEAYYKRIECLFLMKDYSAVITESNKIIGDDSNHSPLLQRISYVKALALMQKNFHKQALLILQQVFNNAVDADLKEKTLLAIMESMFTLNQKQRAVRMLKKLIHNNELAGNILVEPFLLILRMSQDSPEYMTMINELTSKKSLSEKKRNLLLLKKADILKNTGKLQNALTILKIVLKSADESIYPYALYKIAVILSLSGKQTEALEKCKIILKKCDTTSPIYSAALLKTGVLLLNDEKKHNEAKAYFNQLTTKFKTSTEAGTALFYLGYIDFNEKKYDDAKKKFLNAITVSKKEKNHDLKTNSKIYLIWTYLRQNDDNSLMKILKISKNNLFKNAPDAFLLEFARQFISLNPVLTEKALNSLVNKASPKIRQNAYIQLADIKKASDKKKEAEQYLKKALAINADVQLTQQARFKMGKLLMFSGKNEEAVLLFEKCLENPADKRIAAEARLGLAELLAYDNERLQTANRYAMSVFILSEYPDIASEAMLLSIRLSIKMKHKKEAESTFKELSSRFPDVAKSPSAQKLKSQINALR